MHRAHLGSTGGADASHGQVSGAPLASATLGSRPKPLPPPAPAARASAFCAASASSASRQHGASRLPPAASTGAAASALAAAARHPPVGAPRASTSRAPCGEQPALACGGRQLA